MWTAENRARYNRDRLRYPSDLTDDEWALVGRSLMNAKHRAMISSGQDVDLLALELRTFKRSFDLTASSALRAVGAQRDETSAVVDYLFRFVRN